jgi:hypothetical protein
MRLCTEEIISSNLISSNIISLYFFANFNRNISFQDTCKRDSSESPACVHLQLPPQTISRLILTKTFQSMSFGRKSRRWETGKPATYSEKSYQSGPPDSVTTGELSNTVYQSRRRSLQRGHYISLRHYFHIPNPTPTPGILHQFQLRQYAYIILLTYSSSSSSDRLHNLKPSRDHLRNLLVLML